MSLREIRDCMQMAGFQYLLSKEAADFIDKRKWCNQRKWDKGVNNREKQQIKKFNQNQLGFILLTARKQKPRLLLPSNLAEFEKEQSLKDAETGAQKADPPS